jgi:hypothetical protein
MTASKNICQLKVTLDHSKPPIWRRLLVPGNINLFELHAIIQLSMGWTNSHLHMFRIGEEVYGEPEGDEFGDLGTKDETRYKLDKVANHQGIKFHYEYDFGDGWEHTVLVEKIIPAEKGSIYPVCIGGKRACPPEDVGGMWGYEDLLNAIADPHNEEHDNVLEWVGGNFDPEEFDLDEINKVLPHYQRFNEYTPEDDLPDEDEQEESFQKLVSWVQALPKEQLEQFESLALRRDMIAFLAYLGENRVTGTQSTGNLPLKAVREICKQFVDPPVLDDTIGNHTYKLRTEDDVWPLFFIHTLAHVSGMVTGGLGRRWQVTQEGQQFPQLPAPVQVALLLEHWWHRVNWAVSFPVSGLGDGPPAGFNRHTLTCLLELPAGKASSYEAFADRLIRQSGLSWPIQDQVSARNILHSAIERMVVDPLVSFGLVEAGYLTKTRYSYTSRELDTIFLTQAGKGLLELLKALGGISSGVTHE